MRRLGVSRRELFETVERPLLSAHAFIYGLSTHCIIKHPGDVVLDPFCGCGTTIHAAQKLDRLWIGIDVTHLAISLIEKRLKDAFSGALQFGITASKRQDPLVLFGSVSYIANLGTAHLRSGSRVNAGDVFGGRLGAFLAATPDTSLLLAIAANSFSADRV